MMQGATELWTGCPFGCKYCLPVARRWAREYQASDDSGIAGSTARPRTGDPLNLAGLRTAPRPVPPAFLSLFSDPYPPQEEAAGVTRQAIALLHARGAGVRVLTKSGLRAVRDFRRGRRARSGLGAHPDDGFGATLTFSRDEDSLAWEPGAALPSERLAGLEEAHRRGISTWANFMPVIDPEQTLELMARAAPFVELFDLAPLETEGVCAAPRSFDWPTFARRAVELARRLGVAAYARRQLAGEVSAPDEGMVMDRNFWFALCEAARPEWRHVAPRTRAAVVFASAEVWHGEMFEAQMRGGAAAAAGLHRKAAAAVAARLRGS